MAMPTTSRSTFSIEDLGAYCLRSLGAPVINIEIDESQMYDRIDEAVALFCERHYDGTIEVWLPVVATAADKARGTIMTPPELDVVVSLIDPHDNSNGSSVEEFENLNFQLANSDIIKAISGGSSGSDGLVSWQIVNEQIDLMKRFFAPNRRFRHNNVSNELTIQGSWSAGKLLILHGYRFMDQNSEVNIFNERWIKEYSTALIGRQWGVNISKYDGVQLMGGVVMNGDKIFERYDAQVARLTEELKERYELPIDFLMA